MLIIVVTITRASSKLHLWTPKPVNLVNDAWFTEKKRNSSMAS